MLVSPFSSHGSLLLVSVGSLSISQDVCDSSRSCRLPLGTRFSSSRLFPTLMAVVSGVGADCHNETDANRSSITCNVEGDAWLCGDVRGDTDGCGWVNRMLGWGIHHVLLPWCVSAKLPEVMVVAVVKMESFVTGPDHCDEVPRSIPQLGVCRYTIPFGPWTAPPWKCSPRCDAKSPIIPREGFLEWRMADVGAEWHGVVSADELM
jgi:hypothetical protein